MNMLVNRSILENNCVQYTVLLLKVCKRVQKLVESKLYKNNELYMYIETDDRYLVHNVFILLRLCYTEFDIFAVSKKFF